MPPPCSTSAALITGLSIRSACPPPPCNRRTCSASGVRTSGIRRTWEPFPTSTIHRSPWDSRCRSEEHTSELQSHHDLVCRLLLEKKNTQPLQPTSHNHTKINRKN